MNAPMKDPTHAELARLEEEARAAEASLAQEIAEAVSDASEVANTLREVRFKLEEAEARGATGLGPVLTALRGAVAPDVPLVGHESRSLEARADALRARLWVVSAMRHDLRRFTFELGETIKLTDAGREQLAKLAEQPRVAVRPRIDRIRTITADLTGRVTPDSPSAPRRQQPRIRLETAIDLHSRSNFFTGYTENISDGGLFFATRETFAPGTEVELAFSLPGGVEIRAKGEVRWQRAETERLSAGVGIAFTYLSEPAREAIQHFITRREPIYHAR